MKHSEFPPHSEFREHAPTILRLGLSAVFIWFGISQIVNPINFIGYLPDVLFSSGHSTQFVYANGIFEIIAGGLLAVGFWTRLMAFLLGTHLLAIMIVLGYGEAAVRDFGLTIATFAIAMWGPDSWCIDKKVKRR